MSKISCELRDISSDFRAKEVSFEFTVTNNSDKVIHLINVIPLIPEQVQILETKENSDLLIGYEYKQLCSELTQISEEYLKLEEASYRKKYIELYTELQKEMLENLSTLKGILSLYLKMFMLITKNSTLRSSVSFGMQRWKSVLYNIDKYSDAVMFSNTHFKNSEIESVLKKSFELKLQKLELIEKQIIANKDLSKNIIASIEPGSVFSSTYILKCNRRKVDTTKYIFTLITNYETDGEQKQFNQRISKSLEVSPHPIILSTIAIFSSILGAILKQILAFGMEAKTSWIDYKFYTGEVFLNNFAIAVILALIIFNVFEFTELFKNLRNKLTWRSALLIGFLSGVASDRILKAMKELVG